jgi:hypothetical protein
MRKRKQIEETNEALCPLAEKEFPLAEMLRDVLSQNGIRVLSVGSDDSPLSMLHGNSRTYEKLFVRQEDFERARKIAEELFGKDLGR